MHDTASIHFERGSQGRNGKTKGHQGILSVVKGNGQYQIVIGTQVKHVYEAIGERIPRLEAATNQEEPKKNSKLSQFADMLSKIFSPILPVLGATGMIKGILVLLTTWAGWINLRARISSYLSLATV